MSSLQTIVLLFENNACISFCGRLCNVCYWEDCSEDGKLILNFLYHLMGGSQGALVEFLTEGIHHAILVEQYAMLV